MACPAASSSLAPHLPQVDKGDQARLLEHGIEGVEGLRRLYTDVHLADAARTQRFLTDVVGVHCESSLESLLALLGASPGELERAAVLRRAEPHRALVLASLSGFGSAGASLDRLQSVLLATEAEPRYNCSREELWVVLEDLQEDGLAQMQGCDVCSCTDLALQLVDKATSGARRAPGSPAPQDQQQQQQRRRHSSGGGQVVRLASSLGAPRRGGLSPTPRRSPSPARTWGMPGYALTPSPFALVGAVAAARSSSTSSVLTSKSPQGARGVDAEELRSLEELAEFERPVLDLLQNYSGLTLERLDGLLYMSTKEPRYNQGVARLQLLLEAMEAQGTVKNDGNVYRYLRRTPEPFRRAGSGAGHSATLSHNGNGNGVRPLLPSSRASSSSSGGGGSHVGGAPRPNLSSLEEPLHLGAYEGRVLEVLNKYQVGLPLERLNNMLRMTPGSPRYEAAPEQLQPLLARLVQEGKVQLDQGTYRVASASSSASAVSPPAARVSPPAVCKSTSLSRGVPAAPLAMNDIKSYESAVLELLQNYAGLTLERLDALLQSSAKAVGYRSSPGPLSQLLGHLVQDGKVDVDSQGTYRYKPSRASSPATLRISCSPQPASVPPAPRLPPMPAGSRRRPTASSPPGGATPRMGDISSYESAVLELLQNYAGLTLERLDALLASAGARAPGYISSPAALAGLLTSLQAQGRVTKEGEVFRYRTSGCSPQARRTRSPSPTRAPAAAAASATRPNASSPLAPTGPSSLQFGSRAASSPPPAALLVPEDDWGAYESTLMMLLGNFGAMPLERLQEMLQMSMAWPRYDRTPAQLASYLAALQAAGKLVSDNGLYRKAGTPPPARTPPYASTPRSLAAAEGHALTTLAAYPGLTLERLLNMLRLSKDGPAQDLEENQLAALLSSLVVQGKVVTENGLYKAAPGVSPRPVVASTSSGSALKPSGASVLGVARAVGPLSADQAQLLDSLGLPTQDGLGGFTPFAEVWNGRWAMLAILASVVVELRSGSGTLEQLGMQGLPSMELFLTLSTGAGVAVLGGTAWTLFRFLTDQMDAREKQRYTSLLSGGSKQPDQPERFFTDELKYARMAELVNGRAAMVGFLFAVIMEALTGRGVVGQAILYMKLLGMLGEDSGF